MGLALWVMTVGLCAQTFAGIRWYNPLDQGGTLVHGRAWGEETGANFHRLPDRAKGLVRPAVWGLACQSAGLSLKFYTSATAFTVKYTVKGNRSMPHMPMTGVSGVDLYVTNEDGDVYWCAGNYHFGDTIVYEYKNLNTSRRHLKGSEYTLYLPLYNEVGCMQIGVPDESFFKFIPPTHEMPVVVYGTSIAQGACASRPGMAWSNILQRRLDRPVVNLGFSGNGQLEMPFWGLMSEVEAALYIIDCMPNMTGERVGLIGERVRNGVAELRKRSDAPILLVEHDGYMGYQASDKRREDFARTNEQLKAIYEELRTTVPGLHYLSFEELNLDMDSQVDGVHATDWGMKLYADAYETKIRSILEPVSARSSCFVPCRQRREPDTYEWNERHEAVLVYNRMLQPDYVCIGNSITHYWGGEPEAMRKSGKKVWDDLFQGKRVVNMGFGWDRIENVLWRIRHGELSGFDAKRVFLLIGTNNLEKNTDAEIADGIEEIVTHIHFYQPQAEVVVMGVLPRRGQEKRILLLNKLIASNLKSYAYVQMCDLSADFLLKTKQIDETLFRDGLHPNERGYERMGQRLKRFVN